MLLSLLASPTVESIAAYLPFFLDFVLIFLDHDNNEDEDGSLGGALLSSSWSSMGRDEISPHFQDTPYVHSIDLGPPIFIRAQPEDTFQSESHLSFAASFLNDE